MTERKFYMNTITVEVLTEDAPLNPVDLDDVVEKITYGEAFSGEVKIVPVELSAKEVVAKLNEFHCDPEVFRLDDEGETLP